MKTAWGLKAQHIDIYWDEYIEKYFGVLMINNINYEWILIFICIYSIKNSHVTINTKAMLFGGWGLERD